MKNKLILVTLLLFAAVLYSSTSQAQAIVITNHEVIFTAKGIDYPSIDAKSIVSPSGNVTIIATFQLEKSNELIPEKGTKTILAVLERDDADNEYNSVFCLVNIPPSGRFTIKYQLNGAGYVFPQVWEPYLPLIYP